MSVRDLAIINPYVALAESVRAMLGQPCSDQTQLPFELVPCASVLWCWDSPTQGHLIADIPMHRILNAATISHLGSIALRSILRYPAIVIPDQRRHRLRLCHFNLDANVDCVMLALESMLNQCDVLATLLIDGPPEEGFNTLQARYAKRSHSLC